MRILNKMKAAMLVLMASLFCANVAFAESKTTNFSYSSETIPDNTAGLVLTLDGITVSHGAAGRDDSKAWSGKENGSIEGYTYFITSSDNPRNEKTGAGVSVLPDRGAYVLYEPAYDGSIAAAVCANNGKNNCLLEVDAEGNIKPIAATATAEFTTNEDGTFTFTEKYYGVVTFDVTAGNKYYLFTAGSKMSFYGFSYSYEVTVTSKVAYLCGATETTEAIYTALVNAGMEVTPLNYDATSLTDADVEALAAYDLVVLAGNTGSGTNLAKTANLLVGKVPVLSTKSFWYKHYGTNGGNPGTADNPSLNLVKLVADHPIFAGIAGDEFAVFNDMAKSSGRYLQSNGSFSNGPAQVALAQTNGADCIGEGWLDGKGYLIIPVDGIQPEGYLTADGEALFANAAKYLIAGEQYVNLSKYNEAVVNAEAFKATLNAEDVIEADIIMVMDEAIAGAALWLEELQAEGGYTQEDVDMIADDLNANTAKWGAYMNMKKAEAAAQEVLMRYPEETRVDTVGLIDALRNLPMMVMWETAESLQAHADGVNTACAAFEKTNNQIILDAAKKKANDYAATLDASEETGTMAQMEAYNTLSYYTSDEFFTESGINADNYEMVMSYSQQVDMMIAQYDPMIQKDKSMTAANKSVAEAQEVMASYEDATDEAGLAAAIAKVNEILGELNMWDTMYTIEDLNKAVEELAAARVAFEKENGLEVGVAYYMKNVAAGKFLNGGNSWGTQASLLEHGFDVTLIEQEGGKYAIDTNVPNGAKRYLGSNGYVDSDLAAWTLTKVTGRIYTISLDGANFIGSDGSSVVNLALTDATDAAAQWQFITKDELVAGLADATLENPVDATFFIQGQNFNRADNNRNAAWQGAPALGGANENFCAEKWNCNFDIYQDLAGLPNGYYKVSVQGYYRAGNGGATAMDQNAYLYAGEKSTPLMNINAHAGNSVFEGGNVSTVEGMGIVPNNMATASTAFTAGLYADNSVIVAVTDGTLRIGVKKDVKIEADWTIFDNFELTYYGNDVPAVVADGTYYMKNVAAGKFMNGGNSWGTQASLLDHGFDVKLTYANGKYTIDTNVPNGAKQYLGSNGFVDSDLAEWKIVPAGANYAITLDGVNFIGSDGSSVVNLALTDPTKAEAQWQFITKDELVAALDGATEANPVDATFFISGQNFNRADANRNAAWQGGPALGGANENFCAEKWNVNFDIYQDLAGLPNGYYKLSAQGYYRAGNGGATAMDQNAYLYAGENRTPLMNINAHAGDKTFDGLSGWDVSDIAGLGLVPNNMTIASKAFSAGLYTDNSVIALVTDGTLRIGVKKDVLIDADWTIFDNFELAYIGTAIPSVFASAADSLNAAIADANAWKATLDANNEVDAQVIAQIELGMLPAAQAVAAQPASLAQIEEMIASVNMFVAQTSMTLGQMKAAEAQALFAGFENPSDDAGFETSFNEVFEVANGLATGAYTWADLDAAIAKMRVAQKAFIYENPKTPTATISAIQGANRVVALAHELEGLTIYYKTAETADYMIYTAPFHVSTETTVWAYAEYVSPEAKTYTSDVADYLIASEIVKLNAPIIEVEGIAAETADDLSLDIFMKWDGVGADAQPTGEAVYPEMHVGESLGAGSMVYGLSTVNYLSYADLTGYNKIVFEGTPGVQLRVLMNRVENEGALIEKNPVIGEDGKAEVDFTGMEYVHLNAIKTGWGSPAGTISKISLVKTDGEPVAFNCVVISDQSAIINEYGITPKETITYDFFPWIEAKGECAKVPSKSGVLTSGESINGLEAGLLIVKVAAYGFESAETIKYLGAAENWAGGDAFVTGIDEVNAKEVKEVKYYTISGAQIEEPTSGIYIQRVIFTDGTVKTTTVAGK